MTTTKWCCSLLAMAGLWVLTACKPGTPSQYIQPDEMEDILVDYHLAKGLAQQENSSEYTEALYTRAALEKHGVTQAEFDSSLVYYYKRADRFIDIYKRVADRLEEQALILGATEGEIGKYAALNATGDTANVWANRQMAALMPVAPYNRWEFEMEPDSTYRRGDAFLLQFMSDFTYQSGSKSGVVYVAIEYADTTISHNLHFSTTGFSQLHIDGYDKSDIRAIRGFFYLGNSNEQSSTVRLLFLSNIQLIRFHKQEQDNEQENEADSLARDHIAGPLTPEATGGGNQGGPRDSLLPPDRGAAPDRVDEPLSVSQDR